MKNWGYLELTEYIRNKINNLQAEENYSDYGIAIERVLYEEEMYTIVEGVVEAWIVYITAGELLMDTGDCTYTSYINIMKVINSYDRNIALIELQPSEEANLTERILKVNKSIKEIKFTRATYLELNGGPLKEVLLMLINEDCNIDKSIERIVAEHFITESMDRVVVDWSLWITIGEILAQKGSCTSKEYNKVMNVVNLFDIKFALTKLSNDKTLAEVKLPEDVVKELAERVKTVKEQFKNITVLRP